MKFKTLVLSAQILMFGGLATANADEPFITYGPNVKVVFTQVVEDGFTVTKATATVSETAVDGTITVRRQTQVIVPDGSGGFTKKETQETTVATPAGGGVFSVETTTELLTTPLDGAQAPTAPTETTSETVTDPSVNEGDLNLPASTSFIPIIPELDEPIVISEA
ncbi:hypothetical protein N9A94_01320 [Akkermansiaceae bacterium]|nr:hypothetical protein [Akkermansiaceae bacterium]